VVGPRPLSPRKRGNGPYRLGDGETGQHDRWLAAGVGLAELATSLMVTPRLARGNAVGGPRPGVRGWRPGGRRHAPRAEPVGERPALRSEQPWPAGARWRQPVGAAGWVWPVAAVMAAGAVAGCRGRPPPVVPHRALARWGTPGGTSVGVCRPSPRVGAVRDATVGCGTGNGPGQLTWRSRPSQYGARSLNFWSFPVAVRGSSSRSSTDVGHL
jgi:hypothetical protein